MQQEEDTAMQNEWLYDQLPATDGTCELPVFPSLLPFEKLKWWWRAGKYKWQEDRGGIRSIISYVQPGDTVIDIGAHKGGYLYHLLQCAGKQGSVYAFEPQSRLYHYLQMLQNGFGLQNLVLENLAVSDCNATSKLGIPYNGKQKSSPCASLIQEPPAAVFQSVETVNTVTLDAYCLKKRLRPSFLKVDVEGHEWQVFTGAYSLLREIRPKLLFECELRFAGAEKMQQVFRLLSDMGYRGYFIRDNNTIPLDTFDPSLHQDLQKKPYCNNFVFE
jgi:FkbM family methyltransferase